MGGTSIDLVIESLSPPRRVRYRTFSRKIIGNLVSERQLVNCEIYPVTKHEHPHNSVTKAESRRRLGIVTAGSFRILLQIRKPETDS